MSKVPLTLFLYVTFIDIGLGENEKVFIIVQGSSQLQLWREGKERTCDARALGDHGPKVPSNPEAGLDLFSPSD